MDPSSPTPDDPSTTDSLGESLRPPSLISPSTGSRRLYIPPELLRDIFAAIPHHPSRKRNSTLASLCLVNRTWLAIARPLLYREVRLNVLRRQGLGSISATTPDLTHVSLFPDLVRTVKIASDGVVIPNDVTRLSALLSLLKDVEAINLEPRQARIDGATVPKLVETVILHCPKLRQLELPNPYVHYDQEPVDLNPILSAFPCLESLRGHLKLDHPSTSAPPSPLFHLKRLVLCSPFDLVTFAAMTSNSYDSLTTLSLRIDGSSDLIDLSRFHNLTSLHLVHDPPMIQAQWLDRTFVTPFGLAGERLRLRRILATARNLRISDFALRLRISDRRMREDLPFCVDEHDLEIVVIWSRDPSQPPRKCPVEILPTPTEALPAEVHWARIRREASLIIKEAEISSSVRAVVDFGVKFGLMSSEAASNEFENDWEGDSRSNEDSDDGWNDQAEEERNEAVREMMDDFEDVSEEEEEAEYDESE
ncbi:hypothetical protein JCM16303_006273 [Sporobolomyces ruberrimus]